MWIIFISLNYYWEKRGIDMGNWYAGNEGCFESQGFDTPSAKCKLSVSVHTSISRVNIVTAIKLPIE